MVQVFPKKRKVSQIAPMVASILLFFFKIKDTADQREMRWLKMPKPFASEKK